VPRPHSPPAWHAVVSSGPLRSPLPSVPVEARPPYRGVDTGHFVAKVGSRPGYKSTFVVRPRTCMPPPPPPSFPPVHSRSQVTPLALPYTTRAPRAACVPAAPLSSPEQRLQRPSPPVAAELPHRRPSRPQLWPKSSHGELLLPSASFPDQGRRRSHRIPASCAVPASQVSNCKPPDLPRVFCVN
jgi:hypothetical protein